MGARPHTRDGGDQAAVAVPRGAQSAAGRRAAMSDSLDMLLDLLDLEQIEVDIFRGRSPDESLQRVFGGQVAGQALVAAGRTVPDLSLIHISEPTRLGMISYA